MEHRLLRYFVAVAEETTVSAAAETLRITQPALSRQIRQLERVTGLRLFRRTGIRLELTSEGREFLTVARRVLQAHAQAEDFAESLAAGSMPTVSIAAPRTTLIDIVAPFIATFASADPSPHVSEIAVSPGLGELTADYDLIVAPQHPGNDVEAFPLAALPVWAYVPPSHDWAGQDVIDLVTLCREQVILVPATLKSRQIFEAALHLADATPRSTLEVSHGRLAQGLAAAGRGAAVLTDDAYFGLHPLRILDHHGEPLRVHLHAAWRGDHHGSPTLRELAQRLRDFCAERYGQTLPD